MRECVELDCREGVACAYHLSVAGEHERRYSVVEVIGGKSDVPLLEDLWWR